MKILVIHQVPYRKIRYDLGLDHECHEVTYIGYPHRMADLPADLRCRQILVPAEQDLVTGIVARTSRQDGYDRVLSLSEFGILEAWHVRRYLGVEGPSLSRLERVRDKVVMKQALSNSGLRYPRFVAAARHLSDIPWTGRTVLKPRRGASSEGIAIFATADEALAAHQRAEDPDQFQLEEFVEGSILHADGLVIDGRPVSLVVSRYVGTPLDYVTGNPLGSYQLPPRDEYMAFVARVVRTLDIPSGCLHLEFFETLEGELVFLEVANRMGGAGVVDAHLRHSGVHLPSHEIAVSLGLDQPVRLAPTGRYHGWLVFPGHHLQHGAVPCVHVPAWVREHACVDNLFTLDSMQLLPEQVTYQEWLAPVFIEASHPDSAQLGRILRDFSRSVRVGVEQAA